MTPPHRLPPLTDPVDLLALLGRFLTSLMLTVLAIVNALSGHYAVAIFLAVVSFLLQIVTLRFWRRLVRERQEALARREAENQP